MKDMMPKMHALIEPIVDAHHHIWRLSDVPRLRGARIPRIFGEYSAIARDYLVDEFLASARSSGVVKSVFVQVNVASGKELDEVAWVQSIGDTHGRPDGIVGYADLLAPDVSLTLDRASECDRVRGIRYQLHWHENPQYSYTPRPDLMNDVAWRRGLREVEKRGFLFELQIFPSQMADAARLVAAFPGVTFVLLHAGMIQDRSENGWSTWRTGMHAIASYPNVVTKLSGLGTFLRKCSPELWRPVIRETVGIFGPERCMFGSNFPIESLWSSYSNVVAATVAGLDDLSQSERRGVMHDNALRIYRL